MWIFFGESLNYAREIYVLYEIIEIHYHLKSEQREIYNLTHSTWDESKILKNIIDITI